MMATREGKATGRGRSKRCWVGGILSAFWLSQATTAIPRHVARAQDLNTDERFPLLDRSADGRIGGDELITFMELLGLSPEGAERIFQAALAYTESEDGYLQIDELRAWDEAMVNAFQEASQDNQVTLEEADAAMMDTFNLQLSRADLWTLGINRDEDTDGRVTPTELFPGPIIGRGNTANKSQENGAFSVAVPGLAVGLFSVVVGYPLMFS